MPRGRSFTAFIVDGSLPPEADGGRGEDDEDAGEEHPDVHKASDDQRQESVALLEDPVGQVHGPRLPQRGQLQYADMFHCGALNMNRLPT